jgi:opacity protein-like surface antigen
MHIPEPMVFDLVRGLGAPRGELEANVLAVLPFEDLAGTKNDIRWAPEIEATVLDGLGLELELPFQGGDLEGVKLAAQYTIGMPVPGRYIHGLQGIAEREIDPEQWELTLLYLPGVRFDEVWSLLAMLGGRVTFGADDHGGDHEDVLLNVAVFGEVGPRATVGVETNVRSRVGAETDVMLMPQVHAGFAGHWMIQAGAGARFVASDARAELAFRLIYDF